MALRTDFSSIGSIPTHWHSLNPWANTAVTATLISTLACLHAKRAAVLFTFLTVFLVTRRCSLTRTLNQAIEQAVQVLYEAEEIATERGKVAGAIV